MTKQEFITGLRTRLSDIPEKEAEEHISFYAEMIDDRMEEGLSEAEAVSAIGSVDEIASRIVSEIPHTKNAKEKLKTKGGLKAWEILLLVLGSPIWLSLLVAALAVILSVYAVLWSAVVTLWAVFGSLVGVALGGAIQGLVFAFSGNAVSGGAMIGIAVLCVGLSIFAFFGCLAVTKGLVWLTRRIALYIKDEFTKRRESDE